MATLTSVSFGAPLRLPDLGPIRSNGLANPRGFKWSRARGADDQVVGTAVNSQQLEPRDPNRRSGTKPSGSQLSLQRALRALRAVRERYETGRTAHPDARSYSVNVVVDHGDVAWITAAIEALEKANAAGAAEPAGPEAEVAGRLSPSTLAALIRR